MKNIEDFEYEDFILEGDYPYSKISMRNGSLIN